MFLSRVDYSEIQGYREEGGFIQSAVFMEIAIINFLVGPTKKCLETKLLQIKIVTNLFKQLTPQNHSK